MFYGKGVAHEGGKVNLLEKWTGIGFLNQFTFDFDPIGNPLRIILGGS